MNDLSSVTVSDLEADPYPIYAELRSRPGITYMPCLDVHMVTRWDDLTEAATDPVRFPASVERSPTDRALGASR